MIEASKASLALFSRDFGAYQHQQLRILEFPRYAGFAQSFPNTVPYSEGIGFVARVDSTDVEDMDLPYFVTAHEIAHQWFPYQRMSGDVEGKNVVGVVLRVLRGGDRAATAARRRSSAPDRYPRGSAGLNNRCSHQQGYIHYQKGSLALPPCATCWVRRCCTAPSRRK
jgi:hypothetical protein